MITGNSNRISIACTEHISDNLTEKLNHDVLIPRQERQNGGCHLQVAGRWLQVAGCRSQVAGGRLQLRI